MSIAFLFGLIGMFVGGFRGMLVGAVLGYVAGWGLKTILTTKLGAVQSQFLESTFAVMGALCKADGVVTRDEIAIAESMFAQLRMSDEQKVTARAAFGRGKATGFDLDAEVRKFAQVSGSHRPLLVMFLQIQCAAIAADGNVHPAEHQMLVRVARLLGLTDADVDQLEALLRNGGTAGSAGSTKRTIDDAYGALGLGKAATDTEIKQAYRRLMSQNHPDKLAGKGLPESMREMAEQRTREISVAYNQIKEARGFT